MLNKISFSSFQGLGESELFKVDGIISKVFGVKGLGEDWIKLGVNDQSLLVSLLHNINISIPIAKFILDNVNIDLIENLTNFLSQKGQGLINKMKLVYFHFTFLSFKSCK